MAEVPVWGVLWCDDGVLLSWSILVLLWPHLILFPLPGVSSHMLALTPGGFFLSLSSVGTVPGALGKISSLRGGICPGFRACFHLRNLGAGDGFDSHWLSLAHAFLAEFPQFCSFWSECLLCASPYTLNSFLAAPLWPGYCLCFLVPCLSAITVGGRGPLLSDLCVPWSPLIDQRGLKTVSVLRLTLGVQRGRLFPQGWGPGFPTVSEYFPVSLTSQPVFLSSSLLWCLFWQSGWRSPNLLAVLFPLFLSGGCVWAWSAFRWLPLCSM